MTKMLSSHPMEAPTPFWSWVHWQSTMLGFPGASQAMTAGAHPAIGVKSNSATGSANTSTASQWWSHEPGMVYVTVCAYLPCRGELSGLRQAIPACGPNPPVSSAVAKASSWFSQNSGVRANALLMLAVTLKLAVPEAGPPSME